MQQLRIFALAAVIACGLMGGGCSSDKKSPLDGSIPKDGAGDGGGNVLNFPAFVKDLIVNHTADNTEPVAIDSALPDSEDASIFSSLFQ
jgi:hypothetical protein